MFSTQKVDLNEFKPTKPSTFLYHKTAKTLTNTDNFSAFMEPVIQLFLPDWKSKRITASVTTVRNESESIYSLVLKPGKKWRPHQAGQYLQLSVEKNGALLTRTFSISSPPSQFKENGTIELTIRSQKNGLLTPWLRSALHSRKKVYLSQATGEFTLRQYKKPKLFIAAGSGITPIRSILNEYKHASWFTDAQLMFYVKSKKDCLFIEELNALEKYGLNFQFIYSDDKGRINQQHLDEYCPDFRTRDIYVCGPEGMIKTTTNLLHANQVPEENTHFEYFGSAPIDMTNFALDMTGTNEDDNQAIQIDYLNSKKQTRINPGSKTETLLTIAENEGLNPVSGCRIGICHQCICKKKQGRVYNTKTKRYSDTGSEEIQLCLSIPSGHVELEL